MTKKQEEKYLTWEDLAKLYKERTNHSAYTSLMDCAYRWAVKQKDITETKDGLILNK